MAKLATLRLELERKAPTEIRIFPFGLIETTKGIFSFTKDGAERLMRAAASYGNEFSADFEHQALADPPIVAPAAAWYTLELRDEGLFAVGIRWTERAKTMIEAGEYRYISPAFMTTDAGEIVEFINFALTNLPATKNLDALVAARIGVDHEVSQGLQAKLEALDMSLLALQDKVLHALKERYKDQLDAETWLYIVDLYEDRAVFAFGGTLFEISFAVEAGDVILEAEAVEVEKSYTPRTEGQSMKTLLARLNLKPDASEAEAVAALEQLSAGVTLLGKLQTIVGEGLDLEATVLAWRDGAEAGRVALARLAELELEQTEAKAKTIFASATAAKKCTPALEATLRDLFTTDAGVDVAKLSSYFEAAQPIAALAETPGEKPNLQAHGVDISKGYKALSNQERAALANADPELFKTLRADAGL